MIDILNTLENLLNDDMKEYSMSLFFDTRIRQELPKQYFTEPLGFAKAIAFIKNMDNSFVEAVRTYDNISHKLTELMTFNQDPYYRLAVWLDYQKNGLSTDG